MASNKRFTTRTGNRLGERTEGVIESFLAVAIVLQDRFGYNYADAHRC